MRPKCRCDMVFRFADNRMFLHPVQHFFFIFMSMLSEKKIVQHPRSRSTLLGRSGKSRATTKMSLLHTRSPRSRIYPPDQVCPTVPRAPSTGDTSDVLGNRPHPLHKLRGDEEPPGRRGRPSRRGPSGRGPQRSFLGGSALAEGGASEEGAGRC